MPKPFHHLSLEEFLDLLSRFPFQRRINAVHMHHTWRPNHSQYKGLASIEAMWRFHTQQQGWSDIAQHITVAPDGTIWTGRNWNDPPASAKGHNGNNVSGPFMFEMIGDFDAGKDRFEGSQRETALRVIAHVQEKFTLPPESLHFHNEMSSKSCPGSALRREEILAAVREMRLSLDAGRVMVRAQSEGRPFGAEALERNEKVEGVLRSVSRNGSRAADPFEAEPSEERMTEEDIAALVRQEGFVEPAPGRCRDGGRALDLTPEVLNTLRPHLINLTQGQFSSDGLFQTAPGDVDAIFGEYLGQALTEAQTAGRKLRLVFYAHGGLVAEEDGLRIAAKHVSWWKKNHVYPLSFIWETGLFETIGQLLFGARQRAREFTARDIWDFTSDPVVEEAVRALGGALIWSGMKRNAELSVAAGGGARYVAGKVKAFCDAHGDALELHAVGHSAGAIFHAHFLPTVLDLQVPPFQSVHFLAPAIRVDEFHNRLAARLGKGIKFLNIFTMAKDWEKDDDCAGVYRKSLLYLIHHALESERKTPILGLEESLRADPKLQQLFGLAGHASRTGEVVWAKTKVESGHHASTSTTHGGFDDDPPTMNSVVRRVLGLGDADAVADFAEETRGVRSLTIWKAPNVQPEIFTPSSPWANGYAHPQPASPAVRPMTGAPAPVIGMRNGNRGGGRRRALCVGINQYQSAPLFGCVADAQAWAQTFTQLGFESALLCDEQATRSAILDNLKNLITTSASGDVVVFQYAGHGTQLPDLDGDEADGDTPGDDEALCPYDYESGAFIIDDDVAEVFRGIPPGVNVTCFFDCCHSGTNTRFAVGGPSRSRDPHQRARFIIATEEMKTAHERFRAKFARSRPTGSRGPDSMRQVVFSACRSSEVAWESGGHGDFTVQATTLLRAGIEGLSHEQFQEKITTAFGAAPRQHPELDCAPDSRVRSLLQALVNPDGPAASISPVSPGVVTNSYDPAVLAALAKDLHTLVRLLGK